MNDHLYSQRYNNYDITLTESDRSFQCFINEDDDKIIIN